MSNQYIRLAQWLGKSDALGALGFHCPGEGILSISPIISAHVPDSMKDDLSGTFNGPHLIASKNRI